MAVLRERTRHAHRALEDVLALAAPDAGRPQYAHHVAALWGWMKPIEPMLWGGSWPPGLDVGSRAVKTAWLESDIATAQADDMLPADLVVADPVGRGSQAARFGLAYVIEGSMLGGAVLLRRLGPRLAPWPARYLRGYGTDSARYWREFLAAMADTLVTPTDIDAAADAAQAAFEGLGRWLRAQHATQHPG